MNRIKHVLLDAAADSNSGDVILPFSNSSTINPLCALEMYFSPTFSAISPVLHRKVLTLKVTTSRILNGWASGKIANTTKSLITPSPIEMHLMTIHFHCRLEEQSKVHAITRRALIY